MSEPRQKPTKRKLSPRSLTAVEAARVRAEIVRMHREFGSDKAVAGITGAGAVTLYRIRANDAQAGREVAKMIAAARGMAVEELLAGKVPS
jgi:hypothetical protein